MSEAVALYFHQVKPLENQEQIRRFVAVFQTAGYRISDVSVKIGPSYSDRRDFGDSVDDALPDAHQYRNLRLDASSPHDFLELTASVSWYPPYETEPDAHLYVRSFQDVLFNEGAPENPLYDAAYYGRRVLDIGKQLYAVTLPRFGWSDVGLLEIAPRNADIATFRVFDNVGGVYWANFFSPAYVSHIGRERLENTPIGWSEALVDGGILYVIAPTWFDDNAVEGRRRMKKYFGL
jgi:hypothetical protein